MRSLLVQGKGWFALGNWSQAQESFTAALAWARERNDSLSQGACLYQLGLIVVNQGEIPPALEWLFQARERQSACGDRDGEAQTLCAIGSLYGAAGRYREAGETLAEALALARELKNLRIELGALGSAATLLSTNGDMLQARARYEEVIALAEANGIEALLSPAHNALCAVLAELGEIEKALEHGFVSLRYADERQNLRSRAEIRKTLGAVYRKGGRLAEAERWLHEALSVAEGEPLVEIWTACFHELGRVVQLQGNDSLARHYFEAALQQAIDEGNADDQATQHRALADVCESQGDLPSAIRHLRALIQAEDAVRRQSARTEFMASMARLEWEKSQKEA